MALLESGVWGFYSGDINQDFFVDLADYSVWELQANQFLIGDYVGDLDGDGFVDLGDYPIWEASNNGFVGSILPF